MVSIWVLLKSYYFSNCNLSKIFDNNLAEISQREGARLKKEASKVEPFFVGNVPIQFEAKLSLTDVKTKNYWSETGVAMASCWSCTATPTEMGERTHEKFDDLTEEAEALGFANCHLKMATWRWLKKICCARCYQKYSRTTKEDYASYDQNEKEMLDALKEEPFKLKISTDGRTITGPIAKSAFEHPEALATIFHCPLDLLEDLLILIQTLDCGDMVDWEKFKASCDNWLDRFHQSPIAWCWLPPTLHFMLHHGWQVKNTIISF